MSNFSELYKKYMRLEEEMARVQRAHSVCCIDYENLSDSFVKEVSKRSMLETEYKKLWHSLEEAHRLLSKVVPKDKDLMIEWAAKSKDSTYTNAGAAFRILHDALGEKDD